MNRESCGRIAYVKPGSIAEEAGLEPGDKVVAVNRRPVRDELEFVFECSSESVELAIEKLDGTLETVEIEKDEEEEMGLQFEDSLFDGVTTCTNDCAFCFVRQNPRGVRGSLNIRDDDYRLSFLYGSYITLTNLSDNDLKRIVELRLSPLYVSVHSTIPEVRRSLMGSERAGRLMSQLKYLCSHGIRVHCQIVVCPGINDGLSLSKTIEDLAGLWPEVMSVAVVPVGLTSHREGLRHLRRPDRSECRSLIQVVSAYQMRFLDALGSRFVFASDEFYLVGDEPLPPVEAYEEYPQLENGVGLTRIMIDRFAELCSNPGLPGVLKRRVFVITGKLGARALSQVLSCLPQRISERLTLIPVSNSFFGDLVTVTGLLAGADIVATLDLIGRSSAINGSSADEPCPGPTVLIPMVAVNDDGLFVDGMSTDAVKKAAASLELVPKFVTSDADGLFDALSEELVSE